MPADRPSTRSLLVTLWPFLRPYRGRLTVATVSLMVAAAATLTVPLAFRQMIDLGFVTSQLQAAGGDGSAHVNRAFLALFGLSTILALGTAVRFYSVSWIGERVSADLRNAVYRHVLRQDPRFFETLQAGEVLSRLTADSTLIQTLVGTSVSMGLRNALLFVGSMAMMVYTSPSLAAIIVVLILVVMAPILLVGRRVRSLSRASQDRLADTSAMAGERLNAIHTVQAFAREDFEADRFDRATEGAFGAATRRVRVRAALSAMAIVLIFGTIVFVLWIGARAVIGGTMTAGTLTQFVLYAGLMAGSTGALSEVLGEVQRAAGAAERLMELLAARSAIFKQSAVPGAAATPAAVSPANIASAASTATGSSSSAPKSVGSSAFGSASTGSALQLVDVTFSYPSRPAERALDHVSLSIEPGRTVAIVGPSGAGKSTLFQLLLRFYDPASGAILLDGVDVRTMEPVALRRHVGVVAQDNAVFSADAMENIRYGRLEASDDEVRAAARAAHADEFISRLPEGYQTFLGEKGVRLSGGQRQRIAIARAILKNPPLLLLDEATSALDAESERLVQDALKVAMRGRTTLVIAHRLATVIEADHIVVIDHGRIVEQGTHRELLAAGGQYAGLAKLQFEV